MTANLRHILCRVIDVQYFNAVGRFAGQDFEKKSDERHDPNIALLQQGRGTLGTALDARDYRVEPLFQVPELTRIVASCVRQDVVKVGSRVLREDDRHGLRYRAKVASTSSAVANLPSAASRKPLSTPRSSSSFAI